VRRIAGALLFAFSSWSANADDSAHQMTMDNAHAELSVCLAFYSILRECAGSEAARAETKAAMLRFENMLLDAARAAHLQSSDEQLRLELNLLDQRTFSGNNCSGAGTLRARYAEQCARLLKTDAD
jgi:hypothetical protein